jgi:outer membrane protein OmpA-like peptidoglycan-associated protein
MRIKKALMPVLVAALVLISMAGYAQDGNEAKKDQVQADTLKVPVGQKMNLEGVIVGQENDNLILRGSGGGLYRIVLAGAEIKEKKNNPFRGAKNFSRTDLVQGLQVEVKGTGDSLGSISAREVRMKNDDFKLAQTMDARVVPVETKLKSTQDQLNETERNAQRLSGQVRELSAVTDIVRDSAKAAQSSADGAMVEAKSARSVADNAKVGVKAANERITSLDTYEVKNVTTVKFKAGSALLAEAERSELDKFAENANSETGFLIEVTGFASSDGDEDFNRRLSQKRASAVVQYLAENYSIPIRRFIFPMGYGEKQPVADNTTRDGRKENRRVEVRMLVSKGLVSSDGLPSDLNTSLSAN